MNYKILGHFSFLILFLLAGFFFLERVLYADSAFQFFKIINFERFNIEAGRFSVFLAELIPLLAIKLGAGLKFVIFCFSVSYILIYYIAYLISILIFKDDTAGILIIFLLVLGIRSSFFHPVTETHQALVYSCLFYAWLFNPISLIETLARKCFRLLTGIIIIALCFFSHPVSFFLLLYIIGYFMVSRDTWKDPLIYTLIIFILILYSLKFFVSADNSYEGHYFSIIGSGFHYFRDFFAYESFKFFVHNLGNLYYFHLLIGLFMLIYYLSNRSFVKLIYYLLGILIFFITTVITYYEGDSPMSMEKNFMPLSLFICLPFVREILFEFNKFSRLKFGFVIFVIGISLFNIFSESSVYKNRIEYLSRMVSYSQKFPERKFIIQKQLIDMNKLIIPWALSVETLLFSSLDSPDSSKTFFITDDVNKLNYTKDNVELFMCTDFWLDWNIKELNNKYFKLKEGKYRVITEYIH